MPTPAPTPMPTQSPTAAPVSCVAITADVTFIDIADDEFCAHGLLLGLCGAVDLRTHVRGQPAGFRANCNYTCTGCTRSPTTAPTSAPTSAPSLSPSVPGARPFLSFEWTSNGGTDPLDFSVCGPGGARSGTCSQGFIDEFKAALLADINGMTAVWLGGRNTKVVCTGTGCTVSFLEGTGLSAAEVHALAATLDARRRSVTVHGVVYTLASPVTSGSNTLGPTSAPVHHGKHPSLGSAAVGKTGYHPDDRDLQNVGDALDAMDVRVNPVSVAYVARKTKGVKKKRPKVTSKGSTDDDTASTKASGGRQDVTAIAAVSVVAGVLMAIVGALLWAKRSKKSDADQPVLLKGAFSTVSSQGAAGLSVEDMWEAPEEKRPARELKCERLDLATSQ